MSSIKKLLLTIFILTYSINSSAAAEARGKINNMAYVIGKGLRYDYTAFFKIKNRGSDMKAYADIHQFIDRSSDFKLVATGIYKGCVLASFKTQSNASEGQISIKLANASRKADLRKVKSKRGLAKAEMKVVNSSRYQDANMDDVFLENFCR
ncbi:hypothetical protein [uncultured Pseudoteredinibacter sp.]|uniref:hypothetical protein n=1 Tax=uncultured Pseudoteredinibacter sp. TaxID=1641701 RepID=UPI002617D582|nr:hypothetical protein [uncultured Pseudoteredinibacter sp.]